MYDLRVDEARVQSERSFFLLILCCNFPSHILRVNCSTTHPPMTDDKKEVLGTLAPPSTGSKARRAGIRESGMGVRGGNEREGGACP